MPLTKGRRTVVVGDDLTVADEVRLANTSVIKWGSDIALSRAAASELRANGYLEADADMIARLGDTGQSRIGNVGPSSEAGLKLGSAGDTTIYRSAAGVFGSSAQFYIQRAASGNATYRTALSADTVNRWYIEASGRQWWSDGAAAVDTNLYREAAGILRTDSLFKVGQYLDIIHATAPRLRLNAEATERAYFSYDSATSIARVDTDGTLKLAANNGGSGLLELATDGKLYIGEASDGSNRDTNLYRSAADTLKTDDALVVGGALTVSRNAASYGATINNPNASGRGLQVVVTDPLNVAISTADDGDANASGRFFLRANGEHNWGDGTNFDTNLYRSAADTLRTDDALQVTANQSGLPALLVTNNHAAGSGISAQIGTATNYLLRCIQATGDTQFRVIIDGNGKITWGSGTVAGDTTLYRDAADRLATGSQIRVYRPTANTALSFQVGAEAQLRYYLTAAGQHNWGDGTNPIDTNLYRKGADQLGTDDALFLGNQAAPPATPTAGGVVYVEAGALKFKGSAGTVTVLAPA